MGMVEVEEELEDTSCECLHGARLMQAIHRQQKDAVTEVLDNHPSSIGFQYPLSVDLYQPEESGDGSKYTCEHKNEVTVIEKDYFIKYGATPLHLSASFGNDDILKLLIERL